MLSLLEALGVVTIAELLIWLPPLWKYRKWLSVIVILALTGLSAALFGFHPSIPTLVLLLMSVYRICNLLRILEGRMNEKFLLRVTWRSSWLIVSCQLIIVLSWALMSHWHISTYHLWLVLTYGALAGAVMLAASTVRHIWKTRTPTVEANYADRDLPSLTVAIPARNETDDLEVCLRSLVASNYPKLEILVLDDCSQDKRTPEIIRSFAHAGVRFLRGSVPDDNWLAKNWAYQRLLEESNGELILFCGVDARFEPQSLRKLVVALLQKEKSMVSVVPHNAMPARWLIRDSSLLQPMRYAWELSLPRKLFRRPPVLSTCWLIKRSTLLSAGGFAAVSRSIVPESYFARQAAVHDGYSFMRSSKEIGIASDKTYAEQQATAVRTRYPQVHRRLELVLLLTLAEGLGLIMPYVLLILGIFANLSLQLTIVSAVCVLLLTFSYMQVVHATYRSWLTRSLLFFPVAVLVDIVLMNYSMLRYEFSEVVWKDRNVCIPVMRVEPKLPDIA